MAETVYQSNMKEKISAVRSVVHNKSNNEIVLVLQHFDNDVDKVIQAFVDGSALEVLREWSMSGKKKINKRKRIKSKRQLADKGAEASGEKEGPQGMCGNYSNGFDKDNLSSDSSTEKTDCVLQEEERVTPYQASKACFEEPLPAHSGITGEAHPQQNGLCGTSEPQSTTRVSTSELQIHSAQQKCNRSRPKKTLLAKSLASSGNAEQVLDETNKKKGTNVEKSVKDLHRCTVSLARYRMMVKEEMDISVKKIKASFAELHSCIIEREVALMTEIDKVNHEAINILTARQKKAEELKRMTDLANQMTDAQMSELRAEIKHFVSERKYDEELGRSARYSCDIENLKTQILHCGEISHPKNSYSLRIPSSSSEHSEDLFAPVENHSHNRQNASADIKALGRELKSKCSNGILSHSDEISHPAVFTMKQNGSSNQRRRYNPRPQSLRSNGLPAHEHRYIDPNTRSSSGSEDQLPLHNGFRNRNKGMMKNEDPHSAKRITKNQVLSNSTQGKQPELDPKFLHGKVASVSHCRLQPTRLEISADTTGRSIRTVTLVA
ncbi:SPATS2-like protein [Lissotriton helveticus]